MFNDSKQAWIDFSSLTEVTSTMLIMAIIGALVPTLFYQMFGSVMYTLQVFYVSHHELTFCLCLLQFELRCTGCPDTVDGGSIACSRCYSDQMNPTIDPVYQNNVKPLMCFVLPSFPR